MTATAPSKIPTIERYAQPGADAADDAAAGAGADSVLVRDPICGMTFAPDEAAATRVADGVTYHFCADRCARMFDRQRAQREAVALAPPGPLQTPSAVSPAAARSGAPSWVVPAVGIAAVGAVLAVTVFGLPVSTLLTGAIILACPLMHMFMMRGHGGGDSGAGDHTGHSGRDGHADHAGARGPSGAAGGGKTQAARPAGRSCH